MPARGGVINRFLDRFQLGPPCQGGVRLLGAALLDQGAQGGLASVLMEDPINDYLPAAPTFCVSSYPQLGILICHGLNLK